MKVYHHEQSAEEKAASKRGKRSRRKGHDFERLIVRMLHDEGIEAERGLQSKGGRGRADVTIHRDGAPVYHVECKSGARPNVLQAWRQAREDAAFGADPLAVTHWDRGETLVTMDWDVFVSLLQDAWREDEP